MKDKEQSLDLLHNEAKEPTQAHPKGTTGLLRKPSNLRLKHKMLIIILAFGLWASGWVSVRIFDSLNERQIMLEKQNVQIAPVQTEDMLARINQERASVGISPVKYWQALSVSAKEKACDMRDRNYFEHQDPQGRRGFHYIFDQDLPVNRVGENIAQGFTDPKEEMDSFMASPEHRENILEPYWDYVGYAQCGDYFVQHFAEHSHE